MDALKFAGIMLMAAIALKIGFIIYKQITRGKKDKSDNSLFR